MWSMLRVGAPILSLLVMVGIPFYLHDTGTLTGFAALMAGALACVIWFAGFAAWPLYGLPLCRRMVLGTGQRQILQWAASIPDVDQTYTWLEGGPGVIARSPDGAWICCEGTDFHPVLIGPGTLQSLFIYAFTDPVRLGFMLRAGSRQRCVTIPFVNDLAGARFWRSELQSFVRPAGDPF
ncbi:hypothetical protein M2333_000238 [Sphingobium sp. B11D3B]|nr:hypothetical protein [Sphingobium sp. B11D3B]